MLTACQNSSANQSKVQPDPRKKRWPHWRIQITADAVKDAEAGYRPQLTLVRGLEKQIRNIAEHRDKLAKQASRMNTDNPERAEIEAEVAHMSDEIAALDHKFQTAGMPHITHSKS